MTAPRKSTQAELEKAILGDEFTSTSKLQALFSSDVDRKLDDVEKKSSAAVRAQCTSKLALQFVLRRAVVTPEGEMIAIIRNKIKADIKNGTITSIKDGEDYLKAYKDIVITHLEKIIENPEQANSLLKKMKSEIMKVDDSRVKAYVKKAKEADLKKNILGNERYSYSALTKEFSTPIDAKLNELGTTYSAAVRKQLAPDGGVMKKMNDSIKNSIQAGIESGVITSEAEGRAYMEIYRKIVIDNLDAIAKKPKLENVILDKMQQEVKQLGDALIANKEKQNAVKPSEKKSGLSAYFIRRRASQSSQNENTKQEKSVSESPEPSPQQLTSVAPNMPAKRM